MRAFESLELGAGLGLGQQVIQLQIKGPGLQRLGPGYGGLRRLGAQGVQIRLVGFLFLGPLEEAVQVIAQLHLGLEDVGLQTLAHGVAGFRHLDHLLPGLFASLRQVESRCRPWTGPNRPSPPWPAPR